MLCGLLLFVSRSCEGKKETSSVHVLASTDPEADRWKDLEVSVLYIGSFRIIKPGSCAGSKCGWSSGRRRKRVARLLDFYNFSSNFPLPSHLFSSNRWWTTIPSIIHLWCDRNAVYPFLHKMFSSSLSLSPSHHNPFRICAWTRLIHSLRKGEKFHSCFRFKFTWDWYELRRS